MSTIRKLLWYCNNTFLFCRKRRCTKSYPYFDWNMYGMQNHFKAITVPIFRSKYQFLKNHRRFVKFTRKPLNGLSSFLINFFISLCMIFFSKKLFFALFCKYPTSDEPELFKSIFPRNLKLYEDIFNLLN